VGLKAGVDVVEKRKSLHRLEIGFQISVRPIRSLVTKLTELKTDEVGKKITLLHNIKPCYLQTTCH
jgi:hypothetical protein